MKSRTVVCVGGVVRNGESVLAIRQAQGHSLEGQWSIPWGRLDDGESPAAAVVREIREESGVITAVEGLIGVQELPDPERGWFALVYLCRHLSGVPKPDNRETDAAQFLTAKEIDMLADPIEPWSEWIMRRALNYNFALISENVENPFKPKLGFI